MALATLLATPLAAVAQEGDPLGDALRANRYVVELREGALAGEGGELLVREGRASQLFLIGEEHGVAETPALTAALFRALAPAGYRYLAIETGDGLAAALESRARAPDPMTALTAFYRRHWPGAPFYTLRPEAELLVAAVEAGGTLWGLDYDIVADRYALDRLLALADAPAEREAAIRAKAVADSALDRAMREGNPGRIMMFGGPPSVLAELRQAFDPAPGTEEDRIIALLEETRAINQHWVDGDGWRSNHRRARWNTRQLGRLWREAWERDGAPPRVMMKFGASHMVRGRSFTDVFDLGSAAGGIADALGAESFHLMVAGGAGSRHAVMDPTVMVYRPAPAAIQTAEWAREFFEQADRERWTLFDLRPLRPLAAAGRLGALPEKLERVIHGFDAFLILTGSGPAAMLDIPRPETP